MTQLDSPSTSASLLQQVRQRSESAWQRMTQIYGPAVYGWCRRAGLQSSDAADVTQNVFLAVATGIDRFDFDRADATFRGWLWTIFRSKLMDHYRQRKAEPAAVGQSSGPASVEAAIELASEGGDSSVGDPSEMSLLVRRALRIIEQDFSPVTWQAFWRSAVDEEQTGDIAALLKLTPAAVCMARSRVLRRLRETLAGWKGSADE
ncbi:MAG: sigma-70 family RNA polymerase sigma factor [Pirellulaceae bacterium]